MTVIVRIVVVLLNIWSWRQGKVHEVCDGGLPLATVDGLHGGLEKALAVGRSRFGVERQQEGSRLTDSAIASSSASRDRRCALCCFRRG
jgi:hypothetical protein